AQRVPVDPRGAEVRLVRADVVHDAVPVPRLDAVTMLVEREDQWKYWPPSITIVCPVTKSAAGVQRKTTAPTTSSGTWSRWIVLAETDTSCSASITSGCSRTPSLIVNPGATQLTWMLSRPSSLASDRVSATIAPFDVT